MEWVRKYSARMAFMMLFSETDNWYPKRYLAIDQGPIDGDDQRIIVRDCYGNCL